MKKVALCIAIVLVAAVPSVFAEWNNIANLKVAVLDLNNRVSGEDIDTVTLSEMLQMHLVNQSAFQVVERALIERILEEQEFQMSGVTSSDMMKIGALAGANKIIAGSVSKIGDTYYLLVKGMDTVTGVIDLSDQVMAESLDDLLAVFPVLARRIVRKARGADVPLYVLGGTPDDELMAMPELEGRYAIDGTNPDGSSYGGEVDITFQNGAYQVTWYIGESLYVGVGELEGTTLTVDYGDAFPAIYRVRSDGVLDGIWADGAAYEILTPY